MSLLRRRALIGDEMLTTGELLKQKAAEGVTVCVMPWNERTSWTNPDWPQPMGMMGNFDEETQQFFDGTDVHCRLANRVKGDLMGKDCLETLGGFNLTGGLMNFWTHHQKTIVCDAAPLGGMGDQRRVIAFLGGIDITNGRWDTPTHTIYRSLQTEHASDFANNVNAGLMVTQEYGPREPWEDLHLKVEGPTARDVCRNFTDRWSKLFDDEPWLVDLSDPDTFLPMEAEVVLGPRHPDTWACQVLRSADEHNFLDISGTEREIQYGYCHHIRRAKHFLFIENQYFLGSSQFWQTPSEDCPQLVPFEIMTKVMTKIRAGEPFRAYIIIPMYPEGDPQSKAVQEVLHFQFQTVGMMYARIGEALAEAGSDAHPQDYLMFFCLGNRETVDGCQHTADHSAPSGHPTQDALNASRRTMIYVHSKMMMVDDEVVVMGSANINARSMVGTRDSEIAMAAYQPAHVVEDGGCPRGHVHAYRLALWKEHTGVQEDVFLQPESVECMQRMRELAQANWELYTHDDVMEMDGHLLPYPYSVDQDGTLSALVEHFPDSAGKVVGQDTILPNIMTT